MAATVETMDMLAGKRITSAVEVITTTAGITYSCIKLHFDDNTSCSLGAYAYCCGEAWFEFRSGNPIEEIKSNVITTIVVTDVAADSLPPSGRQEADEVKTVQINFEGAETSPYNFYLRGSSNGYYSCWLEISACIPEKL